ncbi:amidohydrolase [Bacillus ndiopicus]|uniref:amidohydrolase n=1 Tax=Bacillus ndiopicus TaxID=1347368 RepID=UPI0005A6D221|nr:amidohydrolase [Bacillus ndiopicus]
MSKWLLNVRLETGEHLHEDGSVQTITDLFHIEIDEHGHIAQLQASNEMFSPNNAQDMQGQLALPAFKEMHNHLDKTYLSLPWKACRIVNSLEERLHFESLELSILVESCEQRASAMIEKILEHGANHIRTHVNIDPYIGLKNLEGVLAALDKYKDYVTADIIAFPQHGLLRDNVPNLLREALQNGATMLGGLDPGGIDRNIEKSLQTTLEIAQEFNVDVDIHLHDTGHLGYYTIDKWLDLVEANDFQGKTDFSHAFSLGDLTTLEQISIAKRLNEHNVAIMSTIPYDLGKYTIPPIDLLAKHGVNIHFGCDGFYDSWSPNEVGDILQKACSFAEVTRKITERELRQSLSYITNGITPLDHEGTMQWPKVGDEASFVFLRSSCSAEAIARPPKKRIMMNKGKFFN